MDIQTYENIQLNKAYIRLNIKYDGHFYYGSPILEKENKKKSKDKNPSFYYREELQSYYEEAINQGIYKASKVMNFMALKWQESHQDEPGYFDDELLKECSNKFARERYYAIRQSIYKRKKIFKDKAFFNDWNYFTTITYDDGLILDPEIFKTKLLKLLANLKVRHNLKYMLVFEEGEKNERVHAHLLMNVPDDLKEILKIKEHKHYNLNTKTLDVWNESEYFKIRFGRNDFAPVNSTIIKYTSTLDYIIKYIEKTGNKIHYSRGLLGSKIALVNLNDDVILSFTNRFNKSYYVLTWDKFHDENYIESEANKAQERKNQRAYSEKHNLFNFIN